MTKIQVRVLLGQLRQIRMHLLMLPVVQRVQIAMHMKRSRRVPQRALGDQRLVRARPSAPIPRDSLLPTCVGEPALHRHSEAPCGPVHVPDLFAECRPEGHLPPVYEEGVGLDFGAGGPAEEVGQPLHRVPGPIRHHTRPHEQFCLLSQQSLPLQHLLLILRHTVQAIPGAQHQAGLPGEQHHAGYPGPRGLQPHSDDQDSGLSIVVEIPEGPHGQVLQALPLHALLHAALVDFLGEGARILPVDCRPPRHVSIRLPILRIPVGYQVKHEGSESLMHSAHCSHHSHKFVHNDDRVVGAPLGQLSDLVRCLWEHNLRYDCRLMLLARVRRQEGLDSQHRTNDGIVIPTHISSVFVAQQQDGTGTIRPGTLQVNLRKRAPPYVRDET
mmetsp:Transcript_26999/g.60990  ORF Transcript_26999/g.60990 Transcript_26999/m.60990 type:complete len:385 (-) Transcript_26999:220-1374(-)